MTKLNKIDEN